MKTQKNKFGLKNQRGAVGLMVTLLAPVFVIAAWLGVDTYHSFVILPNELQNAADAGALAGAAQLYSDDWYQWLYHQYGSLPGCSAGGPGKPDHRRTSTRRTQTA